MKTPLEQLPGYMEDPNLEPGRAQLIQQLPGQDHPFVINGYIEDLEEDYRRILAQEQRRERAAKIQAVGREAIAAPVSVAATVGRGLGNYFRHLYGEVELAMFDRLEGTNLRQQRDERRRQERILRMAEKIDLLPTTYCAKHEKALKRAHELV